MEYSIICEIVVAIAAVINAIAAGVIAITAVKGITAWKQQLLGKAEFELAQNLLRATFRVRNQMQASRVFLVREYEYPERKVPRELPNNESPMQVQHDWSHIFENRFKLVVNTLCEFNALSVEANIIWGEEILEHTNALLECVSRLRKLMESFVKLSTKAARENKGRYTDEIEKLEKELFSESMADTPLSLMLLDVVNKIEKFLQPKLANTKNK